MRIVVRLCVMSLLTGSMLASAADHDAAVWKDPSRHRVRFLAVDADVKIEVLDWGGKGRPVVLLPGLGNTAHVFDDFAPKLARDYHVYGITRRGYGASSAPPGGYGADRLGDDVLAVLDALKIRKPILIGHSWGGSEVSSVATRHPERIAGAIYLDSDRYAYAINKDETLYDNPQWRRNLNELRRKLEELSNEPRDSAQLIEELLESTLPQFQKDLKAMAAENSEVPKPVVVPSAADLRDWSTAVTWYRRTYEAHRAGKVPESEWRQIIATTPDGRPMFSYRVDPRIPAAIHQGVQRYETIPVPALLIVRASARVVAPRPDDVAEASWANTRARTEGRADAFKRAAPGGGVVLLPGADHYLFLSHEEDVLREIKDFVAALP